MVSFGLACPSAGIHGGHFFAGAANADAGAHRSPRIEWSSKGTGMMRRLAALWLAAAALGGSAGCVSTAPAVPASMRADADFLLHLGLMRGHLLVGHALFALGEQSAAQSHAKHPSDELYAGIGDELARRGVRGFAAELEAHAAAVASGDEAGVTAAYAALQNAIAQTERAVTTSPSLTARLIVLLLEEAAREYAVGIVDGRLENAHEYQDAFGFTQVALELARSQHAALPIGDRDREVFADIAQRIAALDHFWPTLMPPPRLDRDGASIARAASEIARLGLRLRVPSRFDGQLGGSIFRSNGPPGVCGPTIPCSAAVRGALTYALRPGGTVGQRGRLLSGRSQVRILVGAPVRSHRNRADASSTKTPLGVPAQAFEERLFVGFLRRVAHHLVQSSKRWASSPTSMRQRSSRTPSKMMAAA